MVYALKKPFISSPYSTSFNTYKNDVASRPLSRFGSEVRGYAMAAVILEEWLQELAAIGRSNFWFKISPLDGDHSKVS